MNDLDFLPEDFRKEVKVNADGIGYISKRGLGRLVGIDYRSWSQGDSIFNKKIDQYLTQHGFEVTVFLTSFGILDKAAAFVIKWYAHKAGENKTTKAETLDAFLSSMQLRDMIHRATGWKPVEKRERLTADDICEILCLPAPSDWQRRFPVEYYEHLERLTGLTCEGPKRPAIFGQLTKELIYDYLPSGVYEQIKKCKEETGSLAKHHQFLSEDGLLALQKIQEKVLTFMEGSTTIEEVKIAMDRAMTGKYQLLIFEPKLPKLKAKEKMAIVPDDIKKAS
jgi:hypothetical protein